MKVTLGGERLRSEGKMAVELQNFGRSSQNVTKTLRTSQAAGTLVPYWCQIGLDGTTFYIDIATKVKTIPTVGPVFGSFKHQIDIFMIPIRLYIAALHNNALGIGLNMSQVKLPYFQVGWKEPKTISKEPHNLLQVNPSSLLKYLGISGFGHGITPNTNYRNFPAIFLLAYWDAVKNYYANKQEEDAYVIIGNSQVWKKITIEANGTTTTFDSIITNTELKITVSNTTLSTLTIEFDEPVSPTVANEVAIATNYPDNSPTKINWQKLGNSALFQRTDPDAPGIREVSNPKAYAKVFTYKILKSFTFAYNLGAVGARKISLPNKNKIQLQPFKLTMIDEMRTAILAAPASTPFRVNKEPYSWAFMPTNGATEDGQETNTAQSWHSQAGLAVKTYLSDRFNNWLSTEWIDGTTTGINEITSVDVSDGKLSMDALILKKKIFNMLNRIAISDGSYHAWREAVYGVRSTTLPESPIFCGGMQSEIVFEEVINQAGTDEEPLGSLAGRGMDRLHKSGQSIKVKCEEPCMIMAIGSITPRIDYSQGNKWWNRLQTMDDFHKPSLDAIGFQELCTDEMAAWDTLVNSTNNIDYYSVGKQPSWIEYMTDVNETAGDFAAGMPLSFMALNRNYKQSVEEDMTIEDATTYIDPQIYNNIFADASLSAQNFWVQVAFRVTARRVMSAKQIPNM